MEELSKSSTPSGKGRPPDLLIVNQTASPASSSTPHTPAAAPSAGIRYHDMGEDDTLFLFGGCGQQTVVNTPRLFKTTLAPSSRQTHYHHRPHSHHHPHHQQQHHYRRHFSPSASLDRGREGDNNNNQFSASNLDLRGEPSSNTASGASSPGAFSKLLPIKKKKKSTTAYLSKLPLPGISKSSPTPPPPSFQRPDTLIMLNRRFGDTPSPDSLYQRQSPNREFIRHTVSKLFDSVYTSTTATQVHSKGV